MTPWYEQEKKRPKEEKIAEARALAKFWKKASNKSMATHYKTLLKELEG